MTSHAKEILNEAVDRQESLRVSGGFEPPHLSLALAGRLMGDFRSIVFVLPSAVKDTRHHAPVGRRVAAKLVRDQTPRHTGLPFQQLTEEASCRTPIAPWLDEDVDHIAVLVDGPPEILLATLDVHEQFVQVPGVAQASLSAPQDSHISMTSGVDTAP